MSASFLRGNGKQFSRPLVLMRSILDLNQDEAIRAQEKKIEKDISDRLPLVSGLVGLEVLSDEYVDDKVYHSKIKVRSICICLCKILIYCII